VLEMFGPHLTHLTFIHSMPACV